MFDFYNMFYGVGYLDLEDIRLATEVGIITPAEYKKITGKEYMA